MQAQGCHALPQATRTKHLVMNNATFVLCDYGVVLCKGFATTSYT